MILGSVQPSYLAWLPLFARMIASDLFVHLDDVEYSKNSFHNRNRIRNKQGDITLTVPVLYSGNSKSFLSEIEIDYKQKWQEKHFKTIQYAYNKAPYYKDLHDFLEEFYSRKWSTLAELNIYFIDYMADYVGIKTPRYRSSNLGCDQKGNEKLVKICNKLGANRFIVKPGTDAYHPKEFFEKYEIGFSEFTFKALEYPQMNNSFIPNLSILDFVLNCGPGSVELLKKMTDINNV